MADKSLRGYPQLLGLKEIALITRKTNSQVINLRTRVKHKFKEFPTPLEEISGAPVYDISTVINWLRLNGIEYDLSLLRNRVRRDIDKQFAVVGLERVGKSRFVSKFCSHEFILRECLSSAGAAKTRVTTKFIIRKYFPESNCCIRFVSPYSTLNGIQAPLEESAVLDFFDKIENKNYYSLESSYTGKRELNPEEDMVEIYTSTSPLAMALLEEDDDGIIIYDTPGLGGEINSLYNVNVGSYVLMLNDNIHGSVDKAIVNMMPQLAGADIIVTYRTGEQIDNDVDYELMKSTAQKAVSMFTDVLQRLVDDTAIINKSVNLLNPEKTIIPIGPFKSIGTNFAESKFNEDIANGLKRMLTYNTPLAEEEYLDAMIKNRAIDKSGLHHMKDYLSDLIADIAANVVVFKKGDYSRKSYINEGHSRTKHNDNYITLNSMHRSMHNLQKKVYEEFSKLKVNNDCHKRSSNPQEFTLEKDEQELLIKFCFKKIHAAIHSDCGIANGYHPFEGSPPLTMWIQESIMADELFKLHSFNLALPETMGMYKKYVEYMNQLFYSPTWGYVNIRPAYAGRSRYCNRKIEVLAHCKLYSLPTKNLSEFIYNCYNVGLFILGVFSVFNYFTERYDLDDNDIETVGKIADKMRAVN